MISSSNSQAGWPVRVRCVIVVEVGTLYVTMLEVHFPSSFKVRPHNALFEQRCHSTEMKILEK